MGYLQGKIVAKCTASLEGQGISSPNKVDSAGAGQTGYASGLSTLLKAALNFLDSESRAQGEQRYGNA